MEMGFYACVFKIQICFNQLNEPILDKWNTAENNFKSNESNNFDPKKFRYRIIGLMVH